MSSAVAGLVGSRMILEMPLWDMQVLLCNSSHRLGSLPLRFCNPFITFMRLLLCSAMATAAVLRVDLVYSLHCSAFQLSVRTTGLIGRDNVCHARTSYISRRDCKCFEAFLACYSSRSDELEVSNYSSRLPICRDHVTSTESTKSELSTQFES